MLNVLGSVAQFEREMMLERQREGISRAMALGKYKGRKPTAMMQKQEVLDMLAQGVGRRETAVRFGLSERSIYRIIKKYGYTTVDCAAQEAQL